MYHLEVVLLYGSLEQQIMLLLLLACCSLMILSHLLYVPVTVQPQRGSTPYSVPYCDRVPP